MVADKLDILSYVIHRQELDPAYRYKPEEVYDFFTRRLFKQRLHQSNMFEVFFAERGNRKRTKHLMLQLKTAQKRYASLMESTNWQH